MAIYKKNNKWYFRCYFNTFEGKKQHKSRLFDTKKECEEAERLFIMEDKSKKENFHIVALAYFENLFKTRKESTTRSYVLDYNKHIEPYFGDKRFDTISNQDIIKWEDKMSNQNYSIDYLNKLYTILNSIFKYAMKLYDVKSNPVEVVGRFQRKQDEVVKDEDKLRYITLEDFNKFISVIDNPTYYAWFNMAFWTGQRRGEMTALKWTDIDLENGIITVNKTLNEKLKKKVTSTKNNLNRKIQMNNTLIDIMIKYKKQQMQYADFTEDFYVFGGSTYVSETTINRYKHKYFELSGVPEITMHEFRHSHVSCCINSYIQASKEKNMKVDTAKFFLIMSNRMGHTIDVMQRTYMHLFPTIQDEIVDLLNNM